MLFNRMLTKESGRSRLSLRMRLALLIGVMALPMPLLAGLGAWRISYAVRFQQKRLMRMDAQTLAQLVDAECARIESVLQLLAATSAQARQGAQLPALRAQVATASATLGAPVTVMLPDGTRLAWAGYQTPLSGRVPLNQAERQAFITGLPTVGLLRYPADGSGPEIPVAVPYVEAGTVSLVVATRIEPSRLRALLAVRPLQPGWVQSILDRNGTIITNGLHPHSLIGRPAPVPAAQVPAVGSLVTTSHMPESRQSVMALTRAPRSGLIAEVESDTSALNGPIYPFLTGLMAIGLVPTLAGLLAGIVLARRILFAIRALGDVRPGHAPATHLHETDELARALAAAQLALGEGEARWRALAQAVSSVVWRLHADGRINIVSAGGDPALQPLFAPEDWLRHAHPKDRPQAEADFAAARASGDGFTITLRMRAHDGRYHPITLRGVRLTANRQEWIGAVSLAEGPLAPAVATSPA